MRRSPHFLSSFFISLHAGSALFMGGLDPLAQGPALPEYLHCTPLEIVRIWTLSEI